MSKVWDTIVINPMSFKAYFNTEVRPAVMKELGIKNPFAVPSLVKVVLNVGAGEAVTNKGSIAKIQEQLGLIAGQHAVITKARRSVSAFKIRQGLPIGVKVTLRGEKMYSFLQKLVTVVIPRLRDFRGIEDSTVDGHGNLNIGFGEQTLFPEIDYDKIDKVRGLQVTVVTTAKNKKAGRVLFEKLGVGFKK